MWDPLCVTYGRDFWGTWYNDLSWTLVPWPSLILWGIWHKITTATSFLKNFYADNFSVAKQDLFRRQWERSPAVVTGEERPKKMVVVVSLRHHFRERERWVNGGRRELTHCELSSPWSEGSDWLFPPPILMISWNLRSHFFASSGKKIRDAKWYFVQQNFLTLFLDFRCSWDSGR